MMGHPCQQLVLRVNLLRVWIDTRILNRSWPVVPRLPALRLVPRSSKYDTDPLNCRQLDESPKLANRATFP